MASERGQIVEGLREARAKLVEVTADWPSRPVADSARAAIEEAVAILADAEIELQRAEVRT